MDSTSAGLCWDPSQRPAMDSRSVARRRHTSPSVSKVVALREARLHSAVRIPETVAVMIMNVGAHSKYKETA